MVIYLKRMIYHERNMSPLHDKDIYKERKSRRDQDRNEPGYYEVPEEIGLCLGALIKSESREKEEHSYHGVAGGNEYIKTGSYKLLRKPGSAGPLGAVMKYYDNGTEAKEAFRMVEGHEFFVPFFLLAELCSPEEEECQRNINQYDHVKIPPLQHYVKSILGGVLPLNQPNSTIWQGKEQFMHGK